MQRKFNLAKTVCTAGLGLFASYWLPLTFAADPPNTTKPVVAAPTKPASDKPAADKPAADKDKSAEEAAKSEADGADSKPATSKPAGKSAGSPQRFEPSEQVRPDFDVSFPIDI